MSLKGIEPTLVDNNIFVQSKMPEFFYKQAEMIKEECIDIVGTQPFDKKGNYKKDEEHKIKIQLIQEDESYLCIPDICIFGGYRIYGVMPLVEKVLYY